MFNNAENARQKPLIDLLYPNDEKKSEMDARRFELEKLPSDYISNLEVDSLCELLCPTNQYFCRKLLTELCDDEEIIGYRQDILNDFLNVPALLPTLYDAITKMLTNDRTSISQIESIDSFTALKGQISSLDCYISCADRLNEFFDGNKGSIKSQGLGKLLSYFENISKSGEYAHLKECMAELHRALENRIRSVTVAINFDEEMKPISAGVTGYSDKPAGTKPSLFDKILYRGAQFPENVIKGKLYTKYVPTKSIAKEEDINEIDKAVFSELEKITDRYIRTLSEALSSYKKISFEEIYAVESHLDFYGGAVRFIEGAKAREIKMCRPKILPPKSRRAHIKGLFDAAFYKRISSAEHDKKGDALIVRNDISFDDNARFYILTGANNGGKTTFVRAVGICQLLAQAGLYVPAEECEISICDFIYTCFPKEEKIGINSSRFTTEIKEFTEISKTATDKSLLLMNESLQSTTPKECVDIASELTRIFAIIGVKGIFATHLTDIAFMCGEINSDPDVRSKLKSIVVEINEQTGERKYKVSEGMPTQISFAKSVFQKYGIDISRIREKSKRERA